MHQSLAERGSVILWILIAIALFAALSVAVNRGSRTSTSLLTDQQAKLYAMEIISYGDSARQAVRRLRIRGCSENEISFENQITGWANPNAPGDKSCHVYDMAGGGLTYALFPPEGALDTSNKTGGYYQNPYPNAGFQFYQVGTDLSDLTLQMNWLRPEVCAQINRLLGVDNPGGELPVETNDPMALTFTGTFRDTIVANTIGDDPGSGLAGKTAFCRWGGTGGSHAQFNQILIVR